MNFTRFKKIGILLLVLMTALLAACSDKETPSGVHPEAVFSDEFKDDLTIHFFHLEGDEKTGESIFVQTPEGKNILIDAGIPDVGNMVDGYLDDLGVEKLDLVLPSHPHFDHIGGLITIFETKEVDKVIEINVPHDTGPYRDYKNMIESKGIEVEFAEAGDIIELEDDLKMEFLSPPKGTSEDTLPDGYSKLSASHINNVSEVIRMDHGDNSFLFTGDIYVAKEMDLIENYEDKLNVDVVVAPHHGGKTSSSNGFIEAVDPSITMIPANIMERSIINKYEKYGSEVYHSLLDGNILLVSDGKEMKVITEKERKDDK